MQRSLQLQMRKPSIETMGTVDCQQGMEGWYDAAVCGLVREVVGVYSVSSIMCVPEIGIRPLETQGGVVYYFSCSSIRRGPARPPNRRTNWMLRTPVFGNSMPCATEGFSRGVRTSVIIILFGC